MTEPYRIIRRFLLLFKHVGMISLERNDQEIINLSFHFTGLHLNVYLELRECCNLGEKNSRRAWHVILVQEHSFRVVSTLFPPVINVFLLFIIFYFRPPLR